MMKKYAHVENGNISVYDHLPANWRNISNFYSLEGDIERLAELGWSEVQRDTTPYDIYKQRVIAQDYSLVDGVVVETLTLVDLPEADPEVLKAQAWVGIREQRDKLMADFEWRYVRNAREVRLSLTPTDSIESLDTYMQALADITNQEDPFNITWPTYEV